MIFSSDKCPLCNEQLELEIKDRTIGNITKVVFVYTCKNTERIQNDNELIEHQTHYQYENYQDVQLCRMHLPEYTLFHSTQGNISAVYKGGITFKQAKKLVFRTKLLDLDYSQPHVVQNKLKLLVTFS